ncbi:hypothetical protein LINPERHAP2_LOCUS41030 [Linum perenne]
MSQIVKKHKMHANVEDFIAPRVRKNIEKAKERSRLCIARATLNMLCEVVEGNNGFMVDLNFMSCSCGYWGLGGIPCHHAVSAISYLRLEVDDFVQKYYHIEYVARGYTHGIPLLVGQQAWSQVNGYTIHPPRMKCMPGRPKKARRKEASELHPPTSQRGGRTKLRELGMVMHCRTCKQPGYNVRSCTFVAEEPPTEVEGVQQPLVREQAQVREEPPVLELEEEDQDGAGLVNMLDTILGVVQLNGASKLLK